jgi:hypothetical protein
MPDSAAKQNPQRKREASQPLAHVAGRFAQAISNAPNFIGDFSDRQICYAPRATPVQVLSRSG